jgi:hypothetical protein
MSSLLKRLDFNHDDAIIMNEVARSLQKLRDRLIQEVVIKQIGNEQKRDGANKKLVQLVNFLM